MFELSNHTRKRPQSRFQQHLTPFPTSYRSLCLIHQIQACRHLFNLLPEDLLSSSASASRSTLGSSFSNSDKSWSQPRLIRAPQDNTQKLDAKFKQMEENIGDSGFKSIGQFLQFLFNNPIRISGNNGPSLNAFSLIIDIFSWDRSWLGCRSVPSGENQHQDVWNHWAHILSQTQCTIIKIDSLLWPSRSFHSLCSSFWYPTCMSVLVHLGNNFAGKHVYQEIYKLTVKTEDSHLCASANAQRPEENTNLVTWEALGKLSISGLCKKYRERAPVSCI